MSKFKLLFKKTDAQYVKKLRYRYRFRWLLFGIVGLVCAAQIVMAVVFLLPHVLRIVEPVFRVRATDGIIDAEVLEQPGVLEALQAFPYLVLGFAVGSLLVFVTVVPLLMGEFMLSRKNRLLLKYYDLVAEGSSLDCEGHSGQSIIPIYLYIALACTIGLSAQSWFGRWDPWIFFASLFATATILVLLIKKQRAKDGKAQSEEK